MTRTKAVLLSSVVVALAIVGGGRWIHRNHGEGVRTRHEAVLALKALSWDSVTTSQFTMYTVRDSFIAAHAVDYRRQADAAFADALKVLGEPAFPFHVRLFVTRSRDDIELLQGIGTTGWGDPESLSAAVVASDACRPVIRHELMHVVSLRLWGAPYARRDSADAPNALGFDRSSWLREGLAAAAEDLWVRYSYRGMAAQWQEEGGMIPLDSLVNAFARYDDLATYVQSGTLVEYLLTAYGSGRFHELWREGIDGVPRIYSRDVRAIEREWHTWLQHTPAANRPPSIAEARAENHCPPRRR
jgi:hypothetical protein